MLTVSQLTWAHCRRHGRITRHGRRHAVRPPDPTLMERLRLAVHVWLNPWTCLECPRRPRPAPTELAELPRGHATSIEIQPLEELR